jgi:hypothetical protein
MGTSKAIRDFTPLTQAIVEHVLRYRLSVPSAILRLMDRIDPGIKDPTIPLHQLVHSKYLGMDVLCGQESYLFLTPKGAHACGQSLPTVEERWCGPIPERAKIINYAILACCCLSDTTRQRLTLGEFRQHFPQLLRPGLTMNYYVDASGDRPRLGFVRVDMGGHGRWDRILAKCCDDWRAHEAHAGFRSLIDRGEFEISIVTALEQKADRLRHALSAHKQKMVVRICAVRRLLDLIAPEPR